MRRRSFLKIFGKGAAVVAATPVIIGGLAEMIAVKEVAPKFTNQTIIDALNTIKKEHDPLEYVMYTGKQGMKDFNKAMKEFAMEQEHKMMYGIKS